MRAIFISAIVETTPLIIRAFLFALSSRRTWYPNVVHKKFWSPLLERFLDVNVTTSVLRTIEKKGSIDSYLLLTPQRKLDKGLGHTLRAHLTVRRTSFYALHLTLSM